MPADRRLVAWDFRDRTALVTGAGGDIGRAVALRLAAAGANLSLVDVAEPALEETGAACAGLTTVAIHPVDVRDLEQVGKAIHSTAAELGPAQLVFNNAGIQGEFAVTDAYPPDDFHDVLDVNVVGVFNVLRSTAASLRAAGLGGAIVNMASMAHVGPPNMLAYGASKNAVIAMTKTAAKDLAPIGIRVNAISPAFIGPGHMWDRQTEKQAQVGSRYFSDDPQEVAEVMLDSVPLGRLGSVDEVASVVAFLLSDEASYLTGVNIEIAGGAG